LRNYNNLKIKFKYGVNASKSAYNMSEIGACGFDGILVHGRYEKDLIEKLQVIPSERIRIMGYPKHDQFFREKKSVEQIKKKLKIDAPHNKKIITYFPTWGEKSSIDLFYESLLGLKKDYYIVTKPHHRNFYSPEGAERWKKLELISDLLLWTHTPLAYAASVADIIIADSRSGSFSEAAMINPEAPLVGLHVADEASGNYYCSGVYDMCTLVDNPESLQDIVSNIAEGDQRSDKRRLFAQEIFSHIGQNSAKIAVKHILELSRLRKISFRPQPLWLRDLKQKARNVIARFRLP